MACYRHLTDSGTKSNLHDREYALLTGSMADAARQMREPVMRRDDGLLKRGLERQAR